MTLNQLKKSYSILAGTILFLICLGGAVRALNAGLACPDWPLCFGSVIPDFHPQVFMEFIHRAVAGLEALASFYLAFHVFRSREISRSIKVTVGFSLFVLVLQVLMGALTVLKLLQSSVVVMHLGLALVFFGSLLWVRFSLGEAQKQKENENSLVLYAGLGVLVVLSLQILLGGYVASSYSGLACLDFPTCNGYWFPPMVDKVGIQMAHRFGAYFCFFVVLSYFFLVSSEFKKSKTSLEVKSLSRNLLSLILLQVAIGIANVKFLIPALITIMHLLVASALLGVCLRILFLSKRVSSSYTHPSNDV